MESRDASICLDCGHPRSMHFTMPGTTGTCSATVDTRPPHAGGDTLTPCKCKGYRDPARDAAITCEPQPTDGPDYHAEHAFWRETRRFFRGE